MATEVVDKSAAVKNIPGRAVFHDIDEKSVSFLMPSLNDVFTPPSLQIVTPYTATDFSEGLDFRESHASSAQAITADDADCEVEETDAEVY